MVSMAVGTAVGTASTIGLALISIDQAMGLSLLLAAGTIISGPMWETECNRSLPLRLSQLTALNPLIYY